jgi:hypothetical protein
MGFPDNIISSIKLGINAQVRLYQDVQFGGVSQLFIVDDADLSNNRIGSDTASSIRVSLRTGELRIELSSTRGQSYLHSNLWLPAASPYYLGGAGSGSSGGFPWASIDPVNTVHIFKFQPGTYVYAVNSFQDCYDEDCDESPSISYAGAVVRVYQGSTLLRTFSPPPGKYGNWWEVFHLNSDGSIVDVNQIGWISADPYREQVGSIRADFSRPRFGPAAGGCVRATDSTGKVFTTCDDDASDTAIGPGQVQMEKLPFGKYIVKLLPPPGYELIGRSRYSADLMPVRDSAYFSGLTVPAGTQKTTLRFHAVSCPLGTINPLKACANNNLKGIGFSTDFSDGDAATDASGNATMTGLLPGNASISAGDFSSPYPYLVRCALEGDDTELHVEFFFMGSFYLDIPEGKVVDCTWVRMTAPSNFGIGISAASGAPGSSLGVVVTGFPPGQSVQIQWDGRFLQWTDPIEPTGTTTLPIQIPTTTKGPHKITAFYDNDLQSTVTINVVPRVKLAPEFGKRGESVEITLRGYAPRTIVRIRWKRGTTWVEVARVTTSGSGSASVGVNVPMWAPEGPNSIRGDALTSDGGRAQARTFMVDAGIHAAEATPTTTPTPTATPEIQATSEPTVEATLTQSQTATPLPTETPSPTIAPTETPTNTPTPIPTETATNVPTSTQTAEKEAPTDQPAT